MEKVKKVKAVKEVKVRKPKSKKVKEVQVEEIKPKYLSDEELRKSTKFSYEQRVQKLQVAVQEQQIRNMHLELQLLSYKQAEKMNEFKVKQNRELELEAKILGQDMTLIKELHIPKAMQQRDSFHRQYMELEKSINTFFVELKKKFNIEGEMSFDPISGEVYDMK